MQPALVIVLVLLLLFASALAFWYYWTRALNKEVYEFKDALEEGKANGSKDGNASGSANGRRRSGGV